MRWGMWKCSRFRVCAIRRRESEEQFFSKALTYHEESRKKFSFAIFFSCLCFLIALNCQSVLLWVESESRRKSKSKKRKRKELRKLSHFFPYTLVYYTVCREPDTGDDDDWSCKCWMKWSEVRKGRLDLLKYLYCYADIALVSFSLSHSVVLLIKSDWIKRKEIMFSLRKQYRR